MFWTAVKSIFIWQKHFCIYCTEFLKRDWFFFFPKVRNKNQQKLHQLLPSCGRPPREQALRNALPLAFRLAAWLLHRILGDHGLQSLGWGPVRSQEVLCRHCSKLWAEVVTAALGVAPWRCASLENRARERVGCLPIQWGSNAPWKDKTPHRRPSSYIMVWREYLYHIIPYVLQMVN